jgi:hypothetical protein
MAARKKKTIRVVVIPVEGAARVEEIPDDLKTMQALVGGYVELVRLERGLELWVNEEGLINELPLNRLASTLATRLIVGTAFVARSNARGDTTSLRPGDVADLLGPPPRCDYSRRARTPAAREVGCPLDHCSCGTHDAESRDHTCPTYGDDPPGL